MTSKKCHLNKSKAAAAAAKQQQKQQQQQQQQQPQNNDCNSSATSATPPSLDAEAIAAAAVAKLSTPLQLLPTATASKSMTSPTSSITSSSSIQLPTEPAPLLAAAAAFNPMLLNPFLLTNQRAAAVGQEALLNSMKTLLPNLSLFAPLSNNKPKIADTLANMFGDEELTHLRQLLETVNATVTRSLLEDNLKKWGQDLLVSHADILQRLAQAQPIPPPQPQQHESDYLDDDDDDFNSDDDEQDSANGKKSRVRTTISDDQASILKQCFAVNEKPTRAELAQIAEKIGHPFKVVKVWFQNTRARDRREGRHSVGSTVSPSPSSSSTASSLIPPNTAFTAAIPSALKTLSPLPANVVFSKFPTPPASSTDSQLQSPSESPQPVKPTATTTAPLDLSTTSKRSSPSNTPPPLVINSDAEDEPMDDDDDEDEVDDFDDEEVEGSTSASPPALTISNPNEGTAKIQFEQMIQEKLISLSPNTAAILPSEPLPKEKATVKKSGVMMSANGEVIAATAPTPVGGVYTCDQCDKTFTKKSSITRHKYEHSGECFLTVFFLNNA